MNKYEEYISKIMEWFFYHFFVGELWVTAASFWNIRNTHKNKNPLKPMAPRDSSINTETYTDRVPMGVLGF